MEYQIVYVIRATRPGEQLIDLRERAPWLGSSWRHVWPSGHHMTLSFLRRFAAQAHVVVVGTVGTTWAQFNSWQWQCPSSLSPPGCARPDIIHTKALF